MACALAHEPAVFISNKSAFANLAPPATRGELLDTSATPQPLTGITIVSANAVMERVAESSTKTSNIVGLIDDGAFQTNCISSLDVPSTDGSPRAIWNRMERRGSISLSHADRTKLSPGASAQASFA